MMRPNSSHPRYGFEITDFVVMAYMAMMVCVAGVFSEKLPDGSGPAVRFATILFAYIAVIRLTDRFDLPMNARLFVRSVALCVSFPFAFMALGRVIEYINPFRAEMTLMKIDRFIFLGHNPNALLQDYLNPTAVDVFQMVYATYYPLFLTPLVLLPFKEHHRFIQYLTAVALLMAGQYIFYMMIPARSPYVIAQMPEYSQFVGLTHHVEGGFVGNHIRSALDGAEGLKFDCFPSGHTAGVMLVLISMASWKKKAGLIVAPLAFGVMFSTIYLQYHYVVDLLAGVVLAVVVFYLGRLLADRYPLHNQSSRGEP